MSSKRILIVEDEFIIAQNLMQILSGLGYAVAGHAFDAEEALQILADGGADLALLDITLGQGMDGIALAHEIQARYGIPYLFLTSHSDSGTIQRATDAHPAGFLVKPFKPSDIHAGIEVALANAAPNPLGDHTFVKVGTQLKKVIYGEITLLQADRVYVELHRKGAPPLIVRESLHAWEEKLPPGFLRVHRSAIVQLKHVDAVNAHTVTVDGMDIVVTRSAREEVLAWIQARKR